MSQCTSRVFDGWEDSVPCRHEAIPGYEVCLSCISKSELLERIEALEAELLFYKNFEKEFRSWFLEYPIDEEDERINTEKLSCSLSKLFKYHQDEWQKMKTNLAEAKIKIRQLENK